MCKLGEGLRSKQFPGVFYTDGSAKGKEMKQILDSAGVSYETADARKEKMRGPVLVANGTFLDIDAVREVLSLT